MCGIFAFQGLKPDLDVLSEAIDGAGARGPHAWGVVWLEGDTLRRAAQLGPLRSAAATVLELTEGSPLVLGHARLATTGYGAADDLNQAQPLMSRYNLLAVAHNGTVTAADDLRAAYNLPDPRTGNDSEVLLDLLHLRAWDPVERMPKALAALGLQPQAAVAVDLVNRCMMAGTTGHPLYLTSRGEGQYVCSRQLTRGKRIEDAWLGRW